MKTKISMLIACMLFAATGIYAQSNQPRSVEDRVKATMEKLAPLQLDQTQMDKTTTVFTDYYTAQSKMREEARASGNRPDRSVYEKLNNDRNEKLKAIFTADQYTKFTNEVEATLRPQRRQGGQGQGTNN
jgi:hypothetical protein